MMQPADSRQRKCIGFAVRATQPHLGCTRLFPSTPNQTWRYSFHDVVRFFSLHQIQCVYSLRFLQSSRGVTHSAQSASLLLGAAVNEMQTAMWAIKPMWQKFNSVLVLQYIAAQVPCNCLICFFLCNRECKVLIGIRKSVIQNSDKVVIAKPIWTLHKPSQVEKLLFDNHTIL